MRPTKVYFDGGARPNPGRIEIAVVAKGRIFLFDDQGSGGSTDAEWLALIAALEVAQSLGLDAFDLLGDSAEVIAQANGTRPCRKPDHLARFQALAQSGAPARIRKIARTQNLAGIALEARRR